MNTIGILGGTFDPPHQGHLILALTAAKAAGLEKVILVPARIPPHKTRPDITCDSLRLAMVKQLCRGHDILGYSEIELNRTGVSYTIDTLVQLGEIYPDNNIRIIIGSDMALDFGTWKDASKIIQIAPPLIAERPGSSLPTDLCTKGIEGLTKAEAQILQQGRFLMPPQDISSTEIRNAVCAGKNPEEYLPDPVADIVRLNKLYTS